MAKKIFFSNVIIHFYSTIAIEAAALDIPNISIGFDGWNNQQTIRKYENYLHLRPLLATGGIRVASSNDDLIASINECLVFPEKGREGRSQITKKFFYRNDGKCSRRVANVIHELVCVQ